VQDDCVAVLAPGVAGDRDVGEAGWGGVILQSAAALWWLSTAPSPQANTAAIQIPCWLNPAWPTA
jgi:hypothetical protein